ncbi:MAG TPA: hypothetical protein VHT75_06725 [Acidimicrobiales bacterium]|nr:hypothetical protein [Acidimicrobiales bacterium]
MNRRRGPLFWASAVAGWAIIGWGVRGALIHHLDTKPPDLVRFFLAGDIIHDLIFAPVVLGAGVAVAWLVRGRWRAPVQAFLIIAGCAALFAWPEIRDYARVNHNPSSLPHNYTANLLVVAGAVLLGVLVVTWLHRRRGTRVRRAPDTGVG